ncbi:hypothetical protein [Salmonella enterica]|uniref:hypothetical protein n=1 Tax=Salmonella enterica TaxID=28901 RepID=UPI001562D8DF|nr:hypothetical protein [Salmonella enterica]
MHSVSFGCWTPKLRVIVYDNFNQDVYKKWLCFIKRYDLKAKRARNVKVISMRWTKQDGIRMYRRLKRTFKRHKNTPYVDYQGRKWAVSPEAAGKHRIFKIKKNWDGGLFYKTYAAHEKENVEDGGGRRIHKQKKNEYRRRRRLTR